MLMGQVSRKLSWEVKEGLAAPREVRPPRHCPGRVGKAAIPGLIRELFGTNHHREPA